jgi:hypothetical protein
VEKSAAVVAVPIKVDAQFLAELQQAQALSRELGEVEAQRAALKDRLAARIERIRQWRAEKNVPPDWLYDGPASQFVPPPAPKLSKPEEKPAAPPAKQP